jgi:hypothetical protein
MGVSYLLLFAIKNTYFGFKRNSQKRSEIKNLGITAQIIIIFEVRVGILRFSQ